MTLPNFITIGRLLLVPLVVVMIADARWSTACVLFGAAGLSDGVDGFIARRFGMRSELGAYLDPLADKALLISIYVSLAVVGILPTWIAVLVVARDLMILSAVIVSWMLNKPVEIKPVMVSKLNTAAQILFAAVTLFCKACGFDPGSIQTFGMGAIMVLTLASGAIYLSIWLRHMAQETHSGL